MKKIHVLLLILFVSCAEKQIRTDEPVRLRRNQSFLGIHFDFHAGADCNEVGINTTPEMIHAIIDMVHPDYIQTDCKGVAGYSSYPTQAGNQAPGIIGDPLRIWRDVTAERGIALYMHYCGIWDQRAIELRPEWAVTKADGTQNKNYNSVFGTYVDQLVIPQMKELAGKYDVDGIWVDADSWAITPDYCDRAVRMFKDATGINNIPKSPSDPHWQEWRQFHREAYRKYLRHYIAAVRSEYPDFQVCSNWAYTHHMPEPVSAAVDFLSGDYTPNNSVNSARYAGRYLVHQGVPWDLMAWSFSHDPHPVVQKPAVQLKREAAIILALGGGFQAYYTQNRDGSVRLDELKEMAEVAEFARARQPYCHHSMQIPQVALLHSTSDYHYNSGSLFSQYKGHSQGLLQCLLECQYSVDLVGEETLGLDMSRFPLIVIPEWKNISPAFRLDLMDYMENGGNLLVIGKETSEQFAMLAGIRSASDTWSVQPAGNGKLGLLPVTVGEEYEKSGDEALRKQVAAAVHAMFPNPLVEVSGSPWVDVSVSQLNGKRLIHLVNTSGDHKSAGIIDKIDAIGPLQVTICCDQKPSRITLQPADRMLEYTYTNGKVQLTVDFLEIYDILVIE